MSRIVVVNLAKGKRNAMLFSRDNGATYAEVGLGSLMDRDMVDKEMPGALEACGLDPSQGWVLGSTCRTRGGCDLGSRGN